MMYAPNMGNMSPQYHASHQMYAPSAVVAGPPHGHMYYQQPAGGAYPSYYAPFVQPAYSMPYGVPMYPVPQPYAVSPHYYDMSGGYGMMPAQGVQPNMYPGNNVNAANNNANKVRRNNQGQYPSNRSNQPRNRDGAQVRSSRSGDEGLGSPGATATEVAVAALDSHSSVPRSFSADADEHGKGEGQDGQVPVIAVPTSDTVATADNSAPASAEESHHTAAEESEKPRVDGEPASSSADKDEKGVHQNGRRDGKKDGNNRPSGKPNRDGEDRQNRKNGGRDGKSGSRPDKEVKKERKSPPVNLNLEKDFPTLVSDLSVLQCGCGWTMMSDDDVCVCVYSNLASLPR